MTLDRSALLATTVGSRYFAVSCLVTLTFATAEKTVAHLVSRRVLAIVLVRFGFYDLFYTHSVFSRFLARSTLLSKL